MGCEVKRATVKKTKKTGSGGLTAAAGFGILLFTFAPVVELADT